MFGRSDRCQAVFRKHRIDGASMAPIGADNAAESAVWRVFISGGSKPD